MDGRLGAWTPGLPGRGTGTASPRERNVLKTDTEKANYALGVDLSRNLRQLGIEIDMDVLVRGLRDGFSGAKLLMTQQEIVAERTARSREMTRQAAERQMKNRKVSGSESK
jgi:FKBP-type peptidyl-prolyl cis-trans isomerase FklB